MSQQKQPGKSKLVYKAEFQWSFLKPAYWGNWLSVIFLYLLFLLPDRITCLVANLLGDLARTINNKRYSIAKTNIQLCFPELSDAEKTEMIKQNFRAQMRSVLHYGMIWWSSRKALEKKIIIKGQEHIENSLQQGRSVIVMTSHSVGLEMAVSAITMRYPISGPFKVLKNP